MSLKSGATLTLSGMFPNQLLQVLLSNVFKLNAKKPGIMSGLDYFRHGPRRVGYSQKVYIWRCIDINIYIIPIHVQSYRTLSWSLLNCTRLFNQTVDAARGILTCRLGTTRSTSMIAITQLMVPRYASKWWTLIHTIHTVLRSITVVTIINVRLSCCSLVVALTKWTHLSDSVAENTDPPSVDEDSGSLESQAHGRHLLTYTIAHTIILNTIPSADSESDLAIPTTSPFLMSRPALHCMVLLTSVALMVFSCLMFIVMVYILVVLIQNHILSK